MLNRSRILVMGLALLVAVIVGCKSEFLAGGKLHYDQKRFPQALENFDKVVEEQPELAEGHMWRARALGELERDEEAEAELTKAAELDPAGEIKSDIDMTRVSFWSRRYTSGQALAKTGDEAREKMLSYRSAGQTQLAAEAEAEMRKSLDAAVERFQRAVTFCPDSVRNYINLGKVYFQLGRTDEGEVVFRKARSMAEGREELQQFLFLVFRSLGVQGLAEETKAGRQRAVEMLTEAATFHRPPDEMATLYFNLGTAHQSIADSSQGDERTVALQKAVEAYQKVLEINPVDPEALENLALVHMSNESWPQAIEIARRLLDTEPWEAERHLFMYRIYNAAGDRENATAHMMLRNSLERGTTVDAGQLREAARACPGSQMQKALLDRGEPEQLYSYTGSTGDEYFIWLFWTEGRVLIFQKCQQVFVGEFRPVEPEKARELLGR